MHTRKVSPHAASVLATGLVLALGLLLLPSQVRAQDVADVAHPAHIHTGTCAELGDVVFPLADVSADAGTPVASHDMGTPEAGGMDGHDMGTPSTGGIEGHDMGTPESAPLGVGVDTSETIVEAALADILAASHAINVHESAENIGNYIACGDIAGAADDSGDLTIELATLNDSGYVGTATLHDNGDGTTTVTITLTHPEM